MAKRNHRPKKQSEIVHELVSQQVKEQVYINPEEKLFYDNADLKHMFNVSDKTLQRWRKSNLVPYFTLGGKIFYPVAHFKEKAKV